jgi:hypothetical protein
MDKKDKIIIAGILGILGFGAAVLKVDTARREEKEEESQATQEDLFQEYADQILEEKKEDEHLLEVIGDQIKAFEKTIPKAPTSSGGPDNARDFNHSLDR